MQRLYYISQGHLPETHLVNIENVCKSGVKLIQLRLKNTSDLIYLETAKKAKQICDTYNAVLIINDAIKVAKQLSIGVHLGKEDETILKAKQELPNNVLIGGTANTLEDCIQLIKQGVNYIGLGPFRFTETKQKLSPVLGLKGYETIVSALKNKGFAIPIYAIGGIEEKDFEYLFALGIYGVAASGLLTNKSEIAIKEIVGRCSR